MSQLIRSCRACSDYKDFLYRCLLLTTRLVSQGYQKPRLRVCLKKFYGRYHHLIDHYEISVSGIINDTIVFNLDLHRITCEAGNAHSSGVPDFTLQWRVHVILLLFADFANVRTSVLLVKDFGFNCFGLSLLCLHWYGLILTLTNVYCDEASMWLYLGLRHHEYFDTSCFSVVLHVWLLTDR